MNARITPGSVPPMDCLSANSASWPATATWRWGPAADVAVSTNRLASGWVRFWNCWLSVTGMNATVLSALMLLAPAALYGLVTGATWGSASILAIILVMRDFDARIGHLHPVGRGEDDLLGVARDLGGRGLQQVDGVGRLGVREGERVRVVRADRLEQAERDDQDDGPDEEHESAMADTPPGEGAH